MRPSRVLREVRNGTVASVAKINIMHPAVIDLCGLAGFSAVWVCGEHGTTDWSMMEHCIRAAKNHDMDVIARVPKGCYSDYIKPFECDASGIMVPHVQSAEEARYIVDSVRAHPIGRRPIDGGNTDGNYCQHTAADYLRFLNEEKILILQIESPEAVENVDEIAAVPGFDFLLFGPGDYAHRIGKHGQVQDPEVLAARKKVEDATKKHGKMGFAVAVPVGPEELKDRGYFCKSIASDVVTLGQGMQQKLEEFRAGMSTGPSSYDKK